MSSKKEDFIFQLQFNIGDRWPDIDLDTIHTISDLAVFIEHRNKVNKWHFLRFLPMYLQVKSWLSKLMSKDISKDFDLNSLSKTHKAELQQYVEENFGKPLTYRRPTTLHALVFTGPVAFILFPLLISTYLVAAKNFSGWIYLSALVGVLVTLLLFKITEPLKTKYSPNTVLQYCKSFYVVNNQKISEDPSREMLVTYLCEEAEAFYGNKYTEHSEIPSA